MFGRSAEIVSNKKLSLFLVLFNPKQLNAFEMQVQRNLVDGVLDSIGTVPCSIYRFRILSSEIRPSF